MSCEPKQRFWKCCSVLEEGFAQTDRAGGLLKLRNTAGWNSGSSNVTEQEEECFLLVTWLDLTVSHTQSRNPFGCVVERSQVMLAGCWGAAVQQWWKCAGICSQSTRCEWIMHRVMRWGLCSGHLGIKTLLRGIWRRKTWHPWADFYGLFFFFFLHLKKEEFVSVPDERREVFLCLRSSAGISGSFSAGLHCGPLCWGRHNLSCHLAPCSPELSLAENFYFLWHKHLNWQIFPLSTLFIEGVCDGGMEVQRKIFLLGKKESSQRGAVISGHYLSSDNNYYRTITSHPSHLNIWCNKAPCPAQWPSKTPLPFQTFARITSVKISFLLFSLKIKFSRFSLTALKF